MRTDKDKKQRVNIITLGCPKNIYDSEVLLNQIGRNGFDIIHEGRPQQGDVVIVNSCGFIKDAKEESIETILEFARQKEEGHIKELFVVGCLTERYKQEIKKEIPEIDRVFGVNHIEGVLGSLRQDYKKQLLGAQTLSTPGHYAYLKIADGCNQACSFCAIPSFKGKFTSSPMEKILWQAENLVSSGVKEIILIAQDTTYYGRDIYKKAMLPGLVEKLAGIDGLDWIRIHYTYPAQFPLKLLDVIAENEKVCNYLDLPLQHIADPVLSRMKRKINKEQTLALLEKIRKTKVDIALRTAFIVGFPGETEEDFDELYDFVREQQFDRMGVFTYSHEEGTAAGKLKDDVPEMIRQERMNILMSMQRNISRTINESRKDKILDVMVDRKEGGIYRGRTQYDSPEIDNEVLIRHKNLTKGEIYKVKITEAKDFELLGELSNES